jgi:predicted transcriptional regulator
MGLMENMRNEHVARLALREPVKVAPETPIRDVIQRMRDAHLGCAIIIDGDNKPTGMFTESMLTQLLVHNREALNEPVSQHMATQWPWVMLSDPISHVLEAMQMKNVRFICVVDEQGRLAGLTGQKGLMEYVAEHFPEQVMVQRIGSTPYLQEREGA